MIVVRSVLTYIWIGSFMVLGLPLRWYYKQIQKKDMEKGALKLHRVVQWYSRGILRLSGMKVEVKGKENIPADGAVLFVGNHQSLLDIVVVVSAIDRPFGFLAKAELSKIPLVNSWILALRSVFIERGETRKGLEAIINSAKVVKTGHGMMVYPEGTRTRDGSIGVFKAGSMKIASKGGACIVPVAIDGAYEAMPPGKIWFYGRTIYLTILPPISAEEVKTIDSTHMAERVRGEIEGCMTKHFR